MVKTVLSHEFNEVVISSELPVVVDVYADWCGPCRMVAPVFESTAKKWSASCRFVKFNLDEGRALAAQLGVSSIPAFLFFSGGKLLGMAVGYKDQRALEQEMNKFFGI